MKYHLFVIANGVKFYAYRPRHPKHRYDFEYLENGNSNIGNRSKVRLGSTQVQNTTKHMSKFGVSIELEIVK